MPDLGRLINEIANAGPRVPADAIEGLAETGEPAVPPLLELLDSVEPDEDDWTPLWVAIALGEIGSPLGVPALVGLLETPEGEVLCEAAVESLAKVGTPALPALQKFAREARAWEARSHAYSAIGLIPDPSSTRFLLAALERDALLWSPLAMALADLGDPSALPALKSLLPKCDEREAPAVNEAINILEGRQPGYPKQHARPWRERYEWLARPESFA